MNNPVADTSRSYDQIFASYDEQTATPTEEMLAFKARFFGAVTGTVADLGCGPGRDLLAFTDMGLDVVGVDLSHGMLSVARTRGRVVRGDLRRPPLRPGTFGGLWSSASLLHVPRPDVPDTLRTWHGLLVPGGVLGLTTSIGIDEGWEQVPYATPTPIQEPLSRWFVHHQPNALLELITAAGFTVTHTERRTSHRDWLMLLASATS